jgi:sigma-B regulation protein RsbU (phosphoserine phosphatase)
MLGSLVLAAGTYLFFMTVGSVEYDNEEQAHTLKRAYDQLRLSADRIKSDMDRARSIQRRLLPKLTNMPLYGHLAWAASFEPQEEVGGDYFDVGMTGRGTVAVIFADVSGHGMGAALITVILKSTFESWLEHDDEILSLVTKINRRLVELTPDASFAAVTVGVYDPQHRAFSYCVCGHNPHPYLVRAADGKPQPLDSAQTLILGVMPNVDARKATVTLAPGDTVVFATDGITEAHDTSNEQYGVVGLQRFLLENAGAPPSAIVAGLLREVESFSAGCEQCDDRTILAFSVC